MKRIIKISVISILILSIQSCIICKIPEESTNDQQKTAERATDLEQ